MIASGARVVGVDLSRGSARAAHMRLGARFVQGDVLRTPFADKIADVVVLADVIEHVRPFERVLAEASRLLVDGGELYVNTINRTRRARWLAVHLAEGIGLVPRGTHDADMVVTPEELTRAAAELGFHRTRLEGEEPDIARTLRRWAVVIRRSDDLSVGYSALFRKPAAASREPLATVGSAAGARP
jgi:2-polyprenyl-6-hydroxyphenyl methylase/3-demethylubiquinone-9 3-methyltransferase